MNPVTVMNDLEELACIYFSPPQESDTAPADSAFCLETANPLPTPGTRTAECRGLCSGPVLSCLASSSWRPQLTLEQTEAWSSLETCPRMHRK